MKKTAFKSTFFASLGLLGLTLFTSCDKDDDTGHKPTPINTEKGVLVLNEGSYGSSNASVSLYNKENKTVRQNIFTNTNNRPIGDVLQSMFVHQERGYLVVNNSNTIEVVNIGNFQSVGVIANLQQPRYFTAHDHQKGYVTEWGTTFGGNGRVSVIDLHTNTITKSVIVGKQPEQLLLHNNKLYVTNNGETFISVIDVATETVTDSIPVGDGPKEITIDASGNIWVLCAGFYQAFPTTTPGRLVKFNPENLTTITTLPFTSTTSQPGNMTINAAKDKLYFAYEGAVYEIPVTATGLPTTPLINRSFYGLGIHPADNTIYGADAGNFSSNGKVISYNTAGTALDSFQVGVTPNGFIFR